MEVVESVRSWGSLGGWGLNYSPFINLSFLKTLFFQHVSSQHCASSTLKNKSLVPFNKISQVIQGSKGRFTEASY